ncbi:MAG: MFS transporter [Thermodesulfobacteriota bacterium]|nr:MFS transporter [Thermodesulfobacteriota bacterium]
MIARFSLYGFLKNQRYFEPFIILFFLENSLSFTQIGILIAFREICININEVPSGALADLYGRRKCMMASFIAYICSFVIFGLSHHYWGFFFAMFFFATGDAFRTGTHKAMIFTWLRLENRIDEKTQVYGYTRSWSKLGSAFSIILATMFVLVTNNYRVVFYLSIIPYVIGLITFMSYPRELDSVSTQTVRPAMLFSLLWQTLKDSMHTQGLRRLMVESMAFEGIFKAVKDYLQPVIMALVIVMPMFTYMDEVRRSSIIVGIVYFILYLASAYASRRSYCIRDYCGGEEQGSIFLWKIMFFIYLVMTPLLYLKSYYLVLAGFVGLYLIQNFWRPILISRFDAYADESRGATVLSMESQVKSISTMIAAPLLGMAVDFVSMHGPGGEFWPVGILGAAAACMILTTAKKDLRQSKV